jgi:hypothetical protein
LSLTQCAAIEVRVLHSDDGATKLCL